MIKRSISVLIIEDCSIIADAYKYILDGIANTKFKIRFAINCDQALQHILDKNNQLVLLDLQLPVSKNERYISGDDLGLLIKQTSIKTKVVVLTSISNPLRIINIINAINPEGFILKSDIDSKQLKSAIKNILQGNTFYSKTIKKYADIKNFKRVAIDDLDRQILYHLSMGEKTKDLSKHIPLSTRAIEVRKTKLKRLLVTKGSSNLIKEAKKLGIV